MSDFNVSQETKKIPFGMAVVGTGVIASCLLLYVLFGWGIYLDLERKDDCAVEVEQTYESNAPEQIALNE